MNVSARLGQDGLVRDVSTEDTELPSEGLKACVRDVIMMLSFPDDVFEEDEVVSVQLRYPLLVGSYEIEGMTVIVCRGTGTWGPPMRLWLPSEILRITLRVAE